MTRCVHCGSSNSSCEWAAPLEISNTHPPCHEGDYDRAKAVEDGWRFLKAMLGVEAGILTLVVIVALIKVY
jgi:hypothetical protein